MAKDIDAILVDMRNNPAGIRFSQVLKVADHFFTRGRKGSQSGTSHVVFKTPWPGDPRVNLQESKGGKAKPYQVQQLLKAIDTLLSGRRTGKDEK